MTATTLAVINCAQLVTLRGPARPRVGAELNELGIITDGALLVRDGRNSKSKSASHKLHGGNGNRTQT